MTAWLDGQLRKARRSCGCPYESTHPEAVIDVLNRNGLTAKLIGTESSPIGLMA